MIKKSVLLTALAIAGFAVTSLAQTVPNYVPSNGLVGWWPFNGNAVDESSNTNDGTVNGATLTTDRFGNVNSAYSFNGTNNRIEIVDAATLRCRKITLSAWVLMNTNAIGQIIYKGNLTNAQSEVYALNGNALFSIKINSNCIAGQGWKNSLFNQSVGQGQWHHLVSTFNGDTIKNYFDGVFSSSNNYNGLIDSCLNSNLRFGYNHNLNNNNGGPWNGKIDDIGIWNRALTKQEITGLYNANVCFQTITVTDTLLINTNLTGFNPVTYQNTIKIWPNPTNDHITIDNGNLANLTGHQIKISNALGQQVFQSAITQQQFYVDMSTWGGNGIYFVNLINAQGVTIETRKIVLQ
jgi:hypothetical protein